jgi:hypothetical protein
MALAHLSAATREDVLAYFRNTWALTDTLFSALASDAAFYLIADKLRRPLIFYLGHPAALYINKMHQAGLVGAWQGWHAGRGAPERHWRFSTRQGKSSQTPTPPPSSLHPTDHVHPYFQQLFETGVDEMSWDDMDVMQVREERALRSAAQRTHCALPSPAHL